MHCIVGARRGLAEAAGGVRPGLPRKWRTIGLLAILGGILTAGSKAKSGRLRADPRRWEPHRRVFERVPRTDRRYIQEPL